MHGGHLCEVELCKEILIWNFPGREGCFNTCRGTWVSYPNAMRKAFGQQILPVRFFPNPITVGEVTANISTFREDLICETTDSLGRQPWY